MFQFLENLTNNSEFDRSPRIAATSSTDMIAVWINNPNNDTWGSVVNTNNIMFSTYNGISWSEPNIISSGFGTILDTTLAYDGVTGTYVFCTDADNNFDTPDDQELWTTTYSSGIWTIPIQLTNDANTDSSPQLVYDSLGTLYMAWII